MVTPLNQNQYTITPVQGQVDQGYIGSVISAMISANESTTLVAGQVVKLDTTLLTGVPQVLALTAATDTAFGMIIRNAKDINAIAGDPIELAQNGTAVYCTSAGAITRGGAVEFLTDGSNKVQAWGGVNPIIGYAFDGASAANALIRVIISIPTISAQGERVVNVTVPLASINAGLTLIPGVAGKKILVSDITARVAGSFTTTTSVDLQSTNASPVKISVMAVAALTSGSVLKPGDSNVSRAAGYAAPLGTGDGVAVANVGTAAAGGTSITYTLTYALI